MAQREALGQVLVIIPTDNEVANLENVLTRLWAYSPEVDALVVDDNSPDGTGALADRLAAANDHLHVLHRPVKAGFATAYLDGFNWGSTGHGVLVEMEADGSYRPEDLPMLSGWRQPTWSRAHGGCEVAVSSTWTGGGNCWLGQETCGSSLS